MMSSMYTRQDCQVSPASRRFMRRWEVAGALQRPNGITVNSYSPSVQRKAVLTSDSAIGICQYPTRRPVTTSALLHRGIVSH